MPEYISAGQILVINELKLIGKIKEIFYWEWIQKLNITNIMDITQYLCLYFEISPNTL
jgi:hypothetical protein